MHRKHSNYSDPSEDNAEVDLDKIDLDDIGEVDDLDDPLLDIGDEIGEDDGDDEDY